VVWAKANVLQSVGFVCWNAALLILLKRWHFLFHHSVHFLTVVSFLGLHTTVECSSSKGLRAPFLPSYTEVYAGQNA
jgi:hypothetical protein